MTFNIHHGRGIDKKLDLNRISQVISKSKADIIGLNEVDSFFSKRSLFTNQIETLANHLNFYFAYAPSLTKTNSTLEKPSQFGNGLLSRYPITKTETHLLSLRSKLTEGRSILESTLNVKGTAVKVYITHLSLHPFLHKKQSRFILEHVKDKALILGDWNMRSGSLKWKRITAKFNDAWFMAGVGNGNTFPSTKPKIRLDYIFATKGIDTIDVQVLDYIPIASDHLPVLGTFSI